MLAASLSFASQLSLSRSPKSWPYIETLLYKEWGAINCPFISVGILKPKYGLRSTGSVVCSKQVSFSFQTAPIQIKYGISAQAVHLPFPQKEDAAVAQTPPKNLKGTNTGMSLFVLSPRVVIETEWTGDPVTSSWWSGWRKISFSWQKDVGGCRVEGRWPGSSIPTSKFSYKSFPLLLPLAESLIW